MAKVQSVAGEVVLLGLNHCSAGLDVREKLAFQPQELVEALRRLHVSLEEAVLLSTCHRTELYVASHGDAPSRALLERELGRVRDIDPDQFADGAYFLSGRAAVEHLFQVSCGLDSVVVGEYQVLGQVRDALAAAEAAGAAGPTLRALFTFAIRLGRRARSGTAIGRTAASISTAAVELARRLVEVESSHIVLVGAGKMGTLAAENLLKRGAGRISVVGRTLERAQRLALQCGDALSFEKLEGVLRDADLVITATNAPHPVVVEGMVARVMQQRRKPLSFIDIAVPRDVEPDVGRLPGVAVYNVDDLQEVAAAGLDERRAEIPKVLRLVEQEADRFEAWCHERRAAPAVVALRRHFDGLRRQEIARRRNRLQDLTPEQWRAVEALTISILNKVLHQPTRAVRAMASNGQSAAVPQILAEVFGVSPAPSRGTAARSLPIDTGTRPLARPASPGETPNDTLEMCGQVNARGPGTGEDGNRTRTLGREES